MKCYLIVGVAYFDPRERDHYQHWDRTPVLLYNIKIKMIIYIFILLDNNMYLLKTTYQYHLLNG